MMNSRRTDTRTMYGVEGGDIGISNTPVDSMVHISESRHGTFVSHQSLSFPYQYNYYESKYP